MKNEMTMIAAMSMDGFITGKDGDTTWISEADHRNFAQLKEDFNVLVMGSVTYDKNNIKADKSGRIMRVILTRHPDKYRSATVDDRLEFHNLTPMKVYEKYSDYGSIAIMGGSHVYEEFLAAGYIRNIILTVEPVELGAGTPLLSSGRSLEEVVVNLPEPEILNLSRPNMPIVAGVDTQLLRYVLPSKIT